MADVMMRVNSCGVQVLLEVGLEHQGRGPAAWVISLGSSLCFGTWPQMASTLNAYTHCSSMKDPSAEWPGSQVRCSLKCSPNEPLFTLYSHCIHTVGCFLMVGSTQIMKPISKRYSGHSSGAVWESRWPSWAVRPNEPSGFCGRKDLLNHASALVSACPQYVSQHPRTLSITSSSSDTLERGCSLMS